MSDINEDVRFVRAQLKTQISLQKFDRIVKDLVDLKHLVHAIRSMLVE